MREDYSYCQASNISYSGSEKKQGIIFADSNWMMKFRKNNNYGETTNDISEYIGSRIFSLLGFDAQQVLLGIYQNEKVVLCKDFMTGRNFTPFNEVGESSLDHQKGDFSYSYDGIEEQIKANKKITDKEYALSLFWDTYIVDALIANKDRHGKNWGYMKKDNKYSPAPIFDNGDSLFAGFNDVEELKYALEDEEEMNEYVFNSPRSVVKNNNGLNDYYSVISSKEYPRCNEAVRRMTPKIKRNLSKILALFDDADLEDTKKEFLKRVIKLRFERIILKTYQELKNEKRND